MKGQLIITAELKRLDDTSKDVNLSKIKSQSAFSRADNALNKRIFPDVNLRKIVQGVK